MDTATIERTRGSPRRAARRRFVWTRRLVVALSVLLLVGAVLPPLSSGPRLAGAAAALIGNETGLPVRIADSEWGWWQGLKLQGFQMQLRDGAKVYIEQVAVCANLWDIVRGRTLQNVRIDGMVADVAVGPDPGDAGNDSPPAADAGKVVTSRAGRLMREREPRTPSSIHGLPLGRLELNGCTLNLRDQATDRVTRVFLPAVNVDLDRQTGAVNWRFSASVDRQGLIAGDGSFIFQRLAVVPKDFGGWLRLACSDVPLGALPEPLLERLGLEALQGSASGQVRLQLHPDADWTVTCQATAAGQGLSLRDRSGHVRELATASAGLTGTWRMITERVDVARAWLDLPGASVVAAEPGLIYDGKAGRVEQSNLVASVTDASTLRDALTGLGLPAPAAADLAGRGEITARVVREGDLTRIALKAAGEELVVDWPAIWQHPRGPLGLLADVTVADDGAMVLESGRLDLPGGEVTATARFEPETVGDRLRFVLRECGATVRWQDIQEFVTQVPAARRWLTAAGNSSGPGSLELSVAKTTARDLRTQLRVDLPREAAISLGDWLRKTPDRDLRLSLEAVLDPAFRSACLETLAVDSGPARVLDCRDLRTRFDSEAIEGTIPVLLVDVQGGLDRLDLSALQQLSPRLAGAIAGIGSADGPVSGSVRASCRADTGEGDTRLTGLDFAGELDLSALALQVTEALDKPAGEPLRIAGSYTCRMDTAGGEGYGYGSGSVDADGFSGQGWYERNSRQDTQWSWGWLDVRDVERATRMLPRVAEVVRRDGAEGGMTARWEWLRRGASFDLHTAFDLTAIGADRSQAGLRKPVGLPARVEASISGPGGDAVGRDACRWRVPRVDLVLGHSHASFTDGQIEIAEPWAKMLAGRGREAWAAIDFTWPIRRAQARASGVTVFGEVLASFSDDLGDLMARYRAGGPVGWTLQCEYAQDRGLAFGAKVDAGDLAVTAGAVDKPAGVPLTASVEGRCLAYYDAANVPHVRVAVDEINARLANLDWSGTVDALCRLGGAQPELVTADVRVTGQTRQVRDVAALVPAVASWQPAGHLAWEAACSFDRQGGWKLDDLQVGAWPVTWDLFDRPCGVEGLLHYDGNAVSATGLAVRVGATAGRFTFDARRDEGSPSVQLGSSFANIDVNELIDVTRQVRRQLREAQPPQTGAAASRPAATSVLSDLSDLHLDFLGRTDGLRVLLGEDAKPIELQLLGWQGSVDGGRIAADLTGSFEGGGLAARVTGRVDGQGPLEVWYRAERALPTDLTQWMVVRSFPGMRVDGPVTLDETIVIDPTAGGKALPSRGEMIVEGGEVWGAAAPRAIQRIFPALELAKFRFTRLRNWFEKDASGRTVNRMIFRGSPWSLYMNGWSEMDGTFRYEVGVDLLGSIESEYWATVDRGRVPLFIKTGKVVDGEMQDEQIRYLSPPQIVARIVKDNVLTIAYHTVRKRVLEGRGQE